MTVWNLGLSTFRSCLKVFADGVFPHGFRHAELNGARKKTISSTFRGCELIRKKNEWEVENQYMKIIHMGPEICKMMRGFLIWPDNSNRIIVDPVLTKKKTQKLAEWGRYCAKFGQFFFCQKRSNVIRFEF